MEYLLIISVAVNIFLTALILRRIIKPPLPATTETKDDTPLQSFSRSDEDEWRLQWNRRGLIPPEDDKGAVTE